MIPSAVSGATFRPGGRAWDAAKLGLTPGPPLRRSPRLPWRGSHCSGRLNRPYYKASQPPRIGPAVPAGSAPFTRNGTGTSTASHQHQVFISPERESGKVTGILGDSSAAAAGRLEQKPTKVTKGRRRKMEAGSIIALGQCESLPEFFVPFVAFCLKDKSAPSTRNEPGRAQHRVKPKYSSAQGEPPGQPRSRRAQQELRPPKWINHGRSTHSSCLVISAGEGQVSPEPLTRIITSSLVAPMVGMTLAAFAGDSFRLVTGRPSDDKPEAQAKAQPGDTPVSSLNSETGFSPAPWGQSSSR